MSTWVTDRQKSVPQLVGQLNHRADLVVVLLAWSLSTPSLAAGPDYDAFSDRDGHIATEQHHRAALALIRNPEHLDAVWADARRDPEHRDKFPGDIAMNLQEALAADRAGELELAAAHYEKVLAGEESLQVLLNLAILYWQATDVGLAAAKRLGLDFLATAGKRFPELLAQAQRRFPGSTEARFWKRYVAWADLGESLGTEECRQLLREDPATLVPAMHLFATSNGGQAREEAKEVLRQCGEDGTTRARYVASVIEGVMRRAGPGDPGRNDGQRPHRLPPGGSD